MNSKHPNHPSDEEQEYDIAAAHDTPESQQTEDANIIVDVSTNQPTTTPLKPSTEEGTESNTTDEYVIEEYEHLKRKNRRRLVGAGALVLVAGGLFAAASQNNPPTTPTLAPETELATASSVADILYPNNNIASEPEHNVDDSKNTPVRLSKKIQAAAPLSPEEKAALEARQRRAKAQRLAQQRKQEAERAEQAAQNKETADMAEDHDNIKQRNVARKKEIDENQRTKKTQTTSTETERNNKNKDTANKQRNEEREQLAKDKKSSDATKQQASSSSSRVTIQAGAFLDKALAERTQQKLKSIHYTSHLEEVQTEKGTVYRVRTGKFANQTEAKNALERIKNQGMNGMILGN